MNLLVATPDGSHTLSPPTEPLRMQSPGETNLIHLSATVQAVGVKEVITGGIVKPKVGVFDEAYR